MTAHHLPVINVIPSDYDGNPQNALGYAWQDYANKIPGADVVATFDPINGIDYKAAVKAKMIEMGVTKAAYNCMWCGGKSDVMTLDAEINTNTETTESAGEEIAETAAIVAAAKKIETEEQDERSKHHVGYCTKCHSYCYGDCEA